MASFFVRRGPARCLKAKSCNHLARPHFSTTTINRSASEHLPRVAQTSFWASLVPKAFRERSSTETKAPTRNWNPATIFIVLGIVMGSNAINLLALRNEMLNFTRRTDARLALLREVIGKVKAGEDVDVKRALGTGDPKAEAEWEEVVRELETTDMLWEGRKKREVRRKDKQEQAEIRERERAAAREGFPKTAKPAVDEKDEQQRPKFLM